MRPPLGPQKKSSSTDQALTPVEAPIKNTFIHFDEQQPDLGDVLGAKCPAQKCWRSQT